MKNIIIGGTVRAGKTTLANLLRQEFGYSKVESDTIVNAFDRVFPQFDITHKNPKLTREKYEPFLFELLNGFCRDLKFTGNVTIFPGAQFLPKNLIKYEKLDKYIVIFLGINVSTKEELFEIIRTNDNEYDWTYKKTDEWLLKFCDNIIKESNILEEECKKYGFYYFNTFYRRDDVMKNICKLINNLQNGK